MAENESGPATEPNQESSAGTDSETANEQTVGAPKTTNLGLLVGLVAVFLAVAIAYLGVYERTPKGPGTAGSSSSSSSSVPIGGPFSLTDHTGRAVTDKDFQGKLMLVMFGYTYCPDVCPTQLSTASDAIDALGDLADKITPIFITIDPERDTVDHLKEYISYFHPSLVALTGTDKQIKEVAKAYRVYFAKSGENKDDPEDYLMDHSAITYLVGADGKFRTHFSHGTDADTMAKRIREFL
jgi:protein SCO1